MAVAKQHHKLLWIGGIGAAGFAAYEWLYKPYQAQQAALLAAATGASADPGYTAAGGGGVPFSPGVTFPTVVNTGITPSNLDPGAAVGGATGSCMYIKGWTQTQCQARLSLLTTAYNQAVAASQQIASGTLQAQAQAQLTATQTALATAMAALDAAAKAGNVAEQGQYQAAVNGYNADIAHLQATLSSLATTKAQWDTAAAQHLADFKALTGGYAPGSA